MILINSMTKYAWKVILVENLETGEVEVRPGVIARIRPNYEKVTRMNGTNYLVATNVVCISYVSKKFVTKFSRRLQ